MEFGLGARELNALDGWQRLGLVVGCVLALAIVIHSLVHDRPPYVKTAWGGAIPWYGLTWDSRFFDCRNSKYYSFTISGCVEAIQQGAGKPEAMTNIFDRFDEPASVPVMVELKTFYDVRVVLILTLLALALPSLLIAVARWIGAGFRRRNPL